VTLTRNKPAGSGLTWQQALDANNPDLSGFRRHGGKLLMYHGLADPFVTPLASLDYYTAVIGATGGSQPVRTTQNFARLFLAPGVTHCGGGPKSDPRGRVGSSKIQYRCRRVLQRLGSIEKLPGLTIYQGETIKDKAWGIPAPLPSDGAVDTARHTDDWSQRAPPAGYVRQVASCFRRAQI
jgi:hypothetical protein